MEEGPNSSTTTPEVEISDSQSLIESSPNQLPFYKKHKWCLIIILLLLFIIIGHALAIIFIYGVCTEEFNCHRMSIMALNTWGMPATFGSQFKSERMKAIAKEIQKGEYDLYLLSELWMEPDHNTIAASIPDGYHMTGFRELSLSTCDGRVAPTACSGLAIIANTTKYPFLNLEFDSYTYHGDPLKSWIDGEWLARKGVGRIELVILGDVKLDIFVTHTAADPDPSHGYNNSYYRVRQVKELMESYVKKSTADVVLLGGDFNAAPTQKEGEPYKMIIEYMTNCVEELFYKLNRWLNSDFATYGNKNNTFSNMYEPVIYDYVFHRTNRKDVIVWTNWFELPLFKTLFEKKMISFSDHEAVTTKIYIKKNFLWL